MEFIINWHGGSLGPGYPNCQYALKYRLRFPVQNGRIISKFIKKLSKIAIFKFDMKPRQPKSIPKISKRRMLVLWDKFFVFGSVQKNIFDDFRSLKGKILIEMPKKREKSQFFHFEMAGRIEKLASNSLKVAIQLHYDLLLKNGGQPKKSIDNFRFHCNIYDSSSKTENFVIWKTRKRVNFFKFIFQP